MNRTLEANKEEVELVSKGDIPYARLRHRFGFVTGKEAFRSDAGADPIIRKTYGVEMHIEYDGTLARGFSVKSAYPFNDDPAGQ